jgi:hypothetical protein
VLIRVDGGEAGRQPTQQAVSDVMAVAIIGFLEVVEVDHHGRDRMVTMLVALDGVERLAQGKSVRQAGETVDAHQPLEALFASVSQTVGSVPLQDVADRGGVAVDECGLVVGPGARTSRHADAEDAAQQAVDG